MISFRGEPRSGSFAPGVLLLAGPLSGQSSEVHVLSYIHTYLPKYVCLHMNLSISFSFCFSAPAILSMHTCSTPCMYPFPQLCKAGSLPCSDTVLANFVITSCHQLPLPPQSNTVLAQALLSPAGTCPTTFRSKRERRGSQIWVS